MKKMRVLSLCTGIGGIDLAAEAADMEIVGQVEIDDFCSRVLAQHWPSVTRLGDIRQVVGDEFGTVDLVAGGIPCQPFSVAGKRRGTADDRHLWPEMLRIIERCQPAFVLVENVAGFVNMVLDAVSADLESRGYETRAFVLPAAAVGAPHLRERCFVVAHAARRGGSRESQIAGGECAMERAGTGASGGIERGYPAARVPLDRRTPCDGTADVADAAHGGIRRGEPSRDTRQFARGGEDLADATRARLATGQPTRQRAYGAQSRAGMESESARHGANGQTQSRLGRAAPRLPTWLDGAHWPSGPGEAQHDWEAPRTVTGQVPNRAARLKALGNAVVPAQVYPILLAIAETWRGAVA